jgi:hypothetical protein
MTPPDALVTAPDALVTVKSALAAPDSTPQALESGRMNVAANTIKISDNEANRNPFALKVRGAADRTKQFTVTSKRERMAAPAARRRGRR